MAELNVRLFGGFEVRRGTGPSIEISTRKAKALFAFLARQPGRQYPRDALAVMLWPDSAGSEARGSLRQALKRVRRALAQCREEAVVSEGDALALRPGVAEIDVECFERLHEVGTPEALEQAAALYVGDFLEGTSLADGEFADWSMMEQMQLREQALDVFSRLLAGYLEEGKSEPAIAAALRLLALDPLQEHVHRRLMRLYLEQDRRGSALGQYRRCRDTLRRELGVRPDPETERLHEAIRRHRGSAARLTGSEPAPCAAPQMPVSAAVDALLARPAVAVLPFANLGGDPAQTYLSDGLSDDIITALAGWRSFPLIASSSSFVYRDRSIDRRDIADELGARYLVEGAVRRSGSKLRISAHLIEAQTARYLWSSRFDLEMADILAVQDEAARKIADAVEGELEQAEFRRIAGRGTEDWSAWDKYLKGWILLKRYTAEDHARARSEFEHALQLDSTYSDAYMGLAQTYLQDIALAADAPREKTLTLGLEAACAAVRLDANSSLACLALGSAHIWAEQYDTAIAETRRSVELNPSNAQARASLGNRLDLAGRPGEGIAQMEYALQLNPRDPRRFRFVGFLARAHITQGEYDAALGWAREAVELRPDLPESYFRLAICLGHLNRTDAARAALRDTERLQPGFLSNRKEWRPYADASRNEHFFAGLRRHNLF